MCLYAVGRSNGDTAVGGARRKTYSPPQAKTPDGSGVKVCPPEGAEESLHYEYPKAPPPSRNLSDVELTRHVKEIEEEEDEDFDDELISQRRKGRRTKTPPPSRNSTSQIPLDDYLINDLGEGEGDGDGVRFLQLPTGGSGDKSSENASQSSTPGTKGHKQSVKLTEETAVAMGFSLSAQGFAVEDIQDGIVLQLNSSDPQSAANISDVSLASDLSSDFSLLNDAGSAKQNTVNGIQGPGDNVNTNQNANPEETINKKDIEETFEMFESQKWEDMTAKHANVLTTLVTSSNPELQQKVLQYIANGASFTKNQVSQATIHVPYYP